MVQETLFAAWRGLQRLQEQASLRAWLYRIATNRCLNALRGASRRPRESLPGPPFEPPPPMRWDEPLRLEPYPDALLTDLADAAPGPEARYEARETVELAFMIALQNLPPRQRAALILKDVLGYRTDEVAGMLETSEASVKGALQRARSTVDKGMHTLGHERAPAPRSEQEGALARKFANAFEKDDIEGVVALLTKDAWLTMPPYPHAYQGRMAVLPPERPARASPRGNRPRRAACLPVLTVAGDSVSYVTRFMNAGAFRFFGLPTMQESSAGPTD